MDPIPAQEATPFESNDALQRLLMRNFASGLMILHPRAEAGREADPSRGSLAGCTGGPARSGTVAGRATQTAAPDAAFGGGNPP
mmetsp:Transcript_869/g.2692  ORF Transcript_869/g.2692 Transcript_869/m.2692 type:complete len:84 (-) Transcript_869:258-509(-)